MKVDTVTIHHSELAAEAEVPPSTVKGWIKRGWAKGPLHEPAAATAAPKSRKSKPRASGKTSPKEGTS